MARLGFRARLIVILALFAALPALAATVISVAALDGVVTLLGGGTMWDRVGESGTRAVAAARQAPLTARQKAAIDEHEAQLSESVTRAHQVRLLAQRFWLVVVSAALLYMLLLAYPTYRVAGHLSRQLGRPLDELVGWTELIARGERLPETAASGAPEFRVLQERMRVMAAQLDAGRIKALEAERLRAFRESSRQFAHELKNPLTPIRFAISRLRRDAPTELADTVSVLATESERLEGMARSFAQFGRLPEGPVADIDVAELVRYTAQAAVPDRITLEMDVTDALVIRGQYDSLSRALSNVLLNAVDACGERGTIRVSARATELRLSPAVRIAVRDSGAGIPADRLPTIWEPYVTHKTGGTGLGLAIARQSIEAHGGEAFATSRPGETEIGFILPINAGLPAITGADHAG